MCCAQEWQLLTAACCAAEQLLRDEWPREKAAAAADAAMQAAHERQRQLAVERHIRRVLVRWTVGSMRSSFLAWRGEAAAAQLARSEAQAQEGTQAPAPQTAQGAHAWHASAVQRARPARIPRLCHHRARLMPAVSRRPLYRERKRDSRVFKSSPLATAGGKWA